MPIDNSLTRPRTFLFNIKTSLHSTRYLLLVFALTLMQVSQAQTAEDSVKQVVNTLFEAMKNADSKQLLSVFGDSAILQSIAQDKAGKTIVRTENLRDFAAFVGKQNKGAADERIEFESIKIDGPLAMVWTPYTFYYNSKFSHCGVNVFQLVRFNGIWKIQYLIDTRRRQGCE